MTTETNGTTDGAAGRGEHILALAASFYAQQLETDRREVLQQRIHLPEAILNKFGVGWANGVLLSHLRESGLTEEECIEAGLAVKDSEGVASDRLKEGFIFPVFVQGHIADVWACKFEGESADWQHIGPDVDYLYNDAAMDGEAVVIVDSILDVLAVEALGRNGVGLMRTDTLNRAIRDLQGHDDVIMCLRNDATGKAAATAIARRTGRKARIASMPDGVCAWGLYVHHDAALDEVLQSAAALPQYLIDQIPVDAEREIQISRFREVLPDIAALAAMDQERALEHAQARLSLQPGELSAARRELRNIKPSADATEKIDLIEMSARFPELIDIVLTSEGAPAFLVRGDDGPSIVADFRGPEGKQLVPPPVGQMPWNLPTERGVMAHYADDSDPALYDDIVAYLEKASELPDERLYRVLASWVLHTYMLESVHYSPIVCLYAVAERGKSRTGRALVFAAYRGFYVESLREAYIFRLAHRCCTTFFFDVRDLSGRAATSGSEDILLLRYEQGAKVARVLHPDKGPFEDTEYFDIFGATVVGTNIAVDELLQTRSIVVHMRPSSRRFDNDVTPASAAVLRDRLTAFRARHFGETLPEVAKPAVGRWGDIMRPLVQMTLLARPAAMPDVVSYIEEAQRQRNTDKSLGLEAQILQAVAGLKSAVHGRLLPIQKITRRVNESQDEADKLSPHKVASVLDALGFQKSKLPNNSMAIVWDDAHLRRTLITYGLDISPGNPGSPAVSG